MRTRRGIDKWNTARLAAGSLALMLATFSASGCGLDWTLPLAHFEGVEEHGYVAYWEKIGDIDLGNGETLPVHIGFNSHRQSNSSVLGKGWIVALLESHVEPVDERTMQVVLPDGWTFLFRRNGNTETWRGNAGWMGETSDTLFTIVAPCGWKIRYDAGKIQEIDGNEIGALTYRYDGGVPTEIDHDGDAVLRVERDPASGAPAALILGEERIEITLDPRPRAISLLGQNLINGFDPSLASLRGPNGKTESFAFGTDKALNPTLTLSTPGEPARTWVWDASSGQVKADGDWVYSLKPMGDHLQISRVAADHESESYEQDDALGLVREKINNGPEIATYRFPGGPLAGAIRKIEEIDGAHTKNILYAASYYPSGQLLREMFYPDTVKIYAENRQLLKETVAGQVVYQQELDDQGRVTHVLDPARNLEIKTAYDATGGRLTQVFQRGQLFYTEQFDRNNRLVSLNEGGK